MRDHKIAPDLLSVLAGFAASHPARRTGGRLTVLFRCRARADFAHLGEHGVFVHQETGPLRTASLPIQAVGRLSDDAAVAWIEPSRRTRWAVDVARETCNVPAFRRRTGRSGRGVVIGILDSGIDAAHPAFAGRIAAVWDQTDATGGGVRLVDHAGARRIYPEGREWTAPQLDGVVDEDGHGTHVAAVAAAHDPPFCGVAPEARLVVVRIDCSTAGLLHGIDYVLAKARGLGLPTVVNMSVTTGHRDPHDGTDVLSQHIDAVSGAGRIVCCAAGNDGEQDIYVRAAIPAGASVEVPFDVRGNSAEIAANGWYARNAGLALSVRCPDGRRTLAQGNAPAGSSLLTTYGPAQGWRDVEVEVDTRPPHPVNDDRQVHVVLRGLPGVPLGRWALVVENTGRTSATLDLWLDADEHRAAFTRPSLGRRIAPPGTAREAITVGSFTTRKTSWMDSTFTQTRQRPGNRLSPFTSDGPLRNGVFKPDLVAPGAYIVAALSAAAVANQDPRNITHDGRLVCCGTSMAAAFVSGVVALLLEGDPRLGPAEAKQALCAQGAQFDPRAGNGLVRLL